MMFGKLYRLEEALKEHGKRQKLQNWENWTTRIRALMGDCENKLAELKSKGEPKDGKDLEEQIILAKVRCVLKRFLYRDTVLFICLFVCFLAISH